MLCMLRVWSLRSVKILCRVVSLMTWFNRTTAVRVVWITVCAGRVGIALLSWKPDWIWCVSRVMRCRCGILGNTWRIRSVAHATRAHVARAGRLRGIFLAFFHQEIEDVDCRSSSRRTRSRRRRFHLGKTDSLGRVCHRIHVFDSRSRRFALAWFGALLLLIQVSLVLLCFTDAALKDLLG